MKISELPLPKSAISFLINEGFSELYPPQTESIQQGLLDFKNILVSAPTASGKTLIAIIAILNHILNKKGKVIYLSPLRALASEKFHEFKKFTSIEFEQTISVQIATGDFDSKEKKLDNGDILVMTNEKLDSVIRHGAEWIENVSLVISDETHLIGEIERGPTLETVLTKMKTLDTSPQILALSATITNAKEIAQWLNCNLVQNEWRPIPLTEGVFDNGTVMMNDGNSFEIASSLRGTAVDLGFDCVKKGGQSLLFAETRKRSSSLASKAADVTSKILKSHEKKSLSEISKKILENNEHTELIKSLSTLISKGVAFHHAGLNQNCRQIIEDEFRNGHIKILASTPTLAAGVNLPARRVVISSILRYDAKSGGNKPISILEYKQLCGRAGRPQFDDFGEAIIIGNSNSTELIEHYVNGIPEPIESNIISDKSLRIHSLSLIVTTPGITKSEILDFFSKTFGGTQIRKSTLKFNLDISIRFLLSEEIIKNKGDRFVATEFGKIISKLYIDPLTAIDFRHTIENSTKKTNHTIGFLFSITNTDEFFPKFSLRQKDFEPMSQLIENHASEVIESISEYDCSRSLLALYYWINESSEISLSDNLNIQSGDMHRMVETSNWLLYCFHELAKQMERIELLDELDALRKRISYGIKNELLELIKIKGIGRVRARKLYNNGIMTLADLSKIPLNKLSSIDKIGPSLAKDIKLQLRNTA